MGQAYSLVEERTRGWKPAQQLSILEWNITGTHIAPGSGMLGLGVFCY